MDVLPFLRDLNVQISRPGAPARLVFGLSKVELTILRRVLSMGEASCQLYPVVGLDGSVIMKISPDLILITSLEVGVPEKDADENIRKIKQAI